MWRSGRSTRASRSTDRHARARLGRPEVRLPRRPLPVPAVGVAQRPQGPVARARAPAQPLGRRARRARRDGAAQRRAEPGRRAAADRRARDGAQRGHGVRHPRRRGARPRRPGRNPPRGPVRLLAPRARRAPGRRDGARGPWLDERHLPQRGGARWADPAPSRRSRADRRQRVHLRRLMLRVAEKTARTDTGRQRRANEDSYFARSPLFAVADGMGGAQAGEVASGTAIEVIEGGLPGGEGNAEERLAGLIADANARIHELSVSDRERAGMGTTLTAAYVDEHEVSLAHVGDSRAYLMRGAAFD